jgi:hypothetical protein
MKNKKALTLWHSALRSFDAERIDEMRAKLEIPEGGFLNIKNYKDWPGFTNIDSLNKLHKYRNEIASMSHSIPVGFSKAIEEYIINGEVTEQTLEECNSTGCQLKFVGSDEATDDFPLGIYVQLGPHSSSADASKFIKSNYSFIENIRGLMFPNRGSRPKAEDYYKNTTIFWLGTMPHEELNHFASQVIKIENPSISSRDNLISKIMGKLGTNVSDDNVRRIISRERGKLTL